MDSPKITFAQEAEALHSFFEQGANHYGKEESRVGMELTQMWGELIAREASIHEALPLFVRVNRAWSSLRHQGCFWPTFVCQATGFLSPAVPIRPD